MSLPTTPRRSHSPQVIDLTFLTEEEEIKLRAVLEEDLKLQQDEENRLKSLRDNITRESIKHATTRPGTHCTRCGTRFGWIFNTGALCPTCSERVCKQDRLYDSYAHTWMCTLCNKRMQLHTSEEVLSRSYGPSHILRLSFRERKRYQQQHEVDKLQGRHQPRLSPVHHRDPHRQHKSPVTMETAPHATSTKGAVPVAMQPPATVQPPEEPVPRSSPVISRKSPSSDIPRSSPVVTNRSPTTVDSQAKIVEITEPLPQPNIVVVTSEETEKQHHQQHDQNHQQHHHQHHQQHNHQHHHQQETVTKDTLVAPYPPGVMVKSNPAITIQGNIYIKVYTKGNKRLVVKADKATGLAAGDGKTSNPFALAYILPDHRRLSKKKSKVELRTTDPVWDTYWEFSTESEDYSGKVLWISVWDWKRFSKSEFLGEVMLPLWTMDLTDKATKSYPLEPEHSVPQSGGDLKLSLRYEPPGADDDDGAKRKKKSKEGRLHVRIQEAQGLFYDNSFVKCFLRPSKYRAHVHQETHIITQPKCPIYDEDFVFEKVTAETLSTDHVLEVTVWDALFVAQPMGVLRLGPHPNGSKPWMDSHGAEVSHWEAMLERPNEWVEQWHVLRPDADFRKVSENRIPSPDIAALTDSYEPLRNSSPDNTSDTEPQPRQRSSSLGNKPATPKSVLVYPGKDVVTDKPADIGNSATFPRRVETKDPLKLDDYELKALTKENTKLNRSSTASLTDVGAKKQVSLLLTEEVKDTTTTSEDHHLTTSGSFINPLTVQSDMSDMQSVYSGSAMYTENEVTGEIQLGISYSENEQTLNVSINKARGLTAPKDDENSTNPYVKIYLLPDRSKTTKKKTLVKKGVDPIFNEVIKYPLSRQHLTQHRLLVGVWHNDFWRHNQFLGEVTLPLDKLDLSNPSDKWYSLEECSHENTKSSKRGQLKISLQFNVTDSNRQKGNLVVTIVSAHGLLQVERTCNPVVKCHLLPDYKKKFKTKVCKDTTDPVWNEKFVFEKLKLEDLRSNRVVELTVWDLTKNKQYDFIGGMRIGPRPHHDNPLPYMDSSDTELAHWTSAMDTPGQSVEQLHTLRHNMDPRTVTIATSEPSTEVTNEMSANKEVPSYDVTMTSQDVIGSHDPVPGYDVTMGSHDPVPGYDVTIGSHDPEPRYESIPVTNAAMVTQPSITVSTEGSPPPDVKVSHHGNEHSPLRTEKLKYDDEDDDHSSTPSHQSQPKAKLPVSPSMDSITSGISIYSQAGGGKGHYDITGSLLLAVYHSNNKLVINVKEAEDIAGVNSNRLSNSYVKLYLLPDPNKETKKKTRTIRKSVNPVFKEEFTYDGSLSHMQGRTLQVSVWNRDRFGHNKFLGEVRLHLGDMLLSDTAHHSYPLQEMDEDDAPAYVGDIRVMLQFVPDQDKKGKKKGRGTLLVWIQQARQLPIVRSGATFVQCTLLPRGKSERFKSELVQGNSDPTYNVKFKFEKVTDVELSYDRALEITIWEPYRNTNEFIGGIRLGPKPQPSNTGASKEWMDSIGSEVTQWELMTARPEQWADEWHALRSSMKPRDILF